VPAFAGGVTGLNIAGEANVEGALVAAWRNVTHQSF